MRKPWRSSFKDFAQKEWREGWWGGLTPLPPPPVDPPLGITTEFYYYLVLSLYDIFFYRVKKVDKVLRENLVKMASRWVIKWVRGCSWQFYAAVIDCIGVRLPYQRKVIGTELANWKMQLLSNLLCHFVTVFKREEYSRRFCSLTFFVSLRID